IIGTIGHSAYLAPLIEQGKLDVSDVAGRWDAFVHQVIEHPFAGVERALVIAGADRRGTMYGVYSFSEAIGVSPWHFWADVPVEPRDDLHALPGRIVDAPVVRYRGIFLNDEAPALTGWVTENFGN